MSTMDALIALKTLLAEPSSWTKGKPARNAEGNRIAPTSDNAVCWCLLGAIYRITYYDHNLFTVICGIMNRLVNSLGLSTYNDDPTTTHADILKLIDTAIEQQKSKEA